LCPAGAATAAGTSGADTELVIIWPQAESASGMAVIVRDFASVFMVILLVGRKKTTTIASVMPERLLPAFTRALYD
jgi:hypothetical protein